jgi:hypothetical protein
VLLARCGTHARLNVEGEYAIFATAGCGVHNGEVNIGFGRMRLSIHCRLCDADDSCSPVTPRGQRNLTTAWEHREDIIAGRKGCMISLATVDTTMDLLIRLYYGDILDGYGNHPTT